MFRRLLRPSLRVLPVLLALLLAAGTAATATEPPPETLLATSVPSAVTGDLTDSTHDATRKKPKPRKRSLVLGVNMAPWDDLSRLDDFALQSGRMPAVWGAWSTWGGAHADFPAVPLQGLRDRGVTPLLTWMPYDPSDGSDSAYSNRKITRGDHDAYLRSWALAAKAYGGTIILRVFHEMDGRWFPWGVGRYGNTSKSFKAAWRHVWNIFRGPKGVGATNVKFLWSPSRPTRHQYHAKLYPGDRYVDYVGFTAFNWARGKRSWKTMAEVFAPPLSTLRRITRKPIVAAETGTSWKGGSKAAWIRKGYPAVYKKWPQLKVVVYFNVNMEPRHPDWSLVRPQSAMDAYKSIVAKPIFQGRLR